MILFKLAENNLLCMLLHAKQRRKWQPTPVFLPGESHEQRSLAGYSPWGHRVGYDLSTKPPEYKCANLQRRYIKKGLLFPSKEDLAHFQLRILG